MAIRVLIVDDSAFMRRAIRRLLEADGAIEIVGEAPDGRMGVDLAKRLRPDVMTLDIQMPVMDGLDALRAIQRECSPAPAIIVCSSLTEEGSHEALQALELGAVEVIANSDGRMASDLITRVKAVASSRVARPRRAETGRAQPPRLDRARTDIVLIGASTGGPPVLETILSGLPSSFPVPIVIAQHMPEMFTRSLADRLSRHCRIDVIHAEPGMALTPGRAYIVPGGRHGRVTPTTLGRLALEVSERPSDALYKPSVDELFASASRIGARCVAIVLTGMGEDGAVGAGELHAAGATILAQEMQTCVVYGMPKAVSERGLASASLSPDEIAASLRTLVDERASAA